MRIRLRAAAACCALQLTALLPAAQSPWADWVEADFPFFSSVVDARSVGDKRFANNLTPRGLVLNLGRDCWACFDPDLLRVSAIWSGRGVTPLALASGSYHNPTRTTPGGQTQLPRTDGAIWVANGIYPGWQTGARPAFDDPRAPAPSPEEIGRGSLAESMGRFKAVRLVRGGTVLEYSVNGAGVREFTIQSEHDGRRVIERHFHLEPAFQPLLLVVGREPDGGAAGSGAAVALGIPPENPGMELLHDDSTWIVRVPAHEEPITFCVAFTDGGGAPTVAPRSIPAEPAAPRWPQAVATRIARSAAQSAYVVDDVPLPLDNPWRRQVRLADIQFLSNGTGVGVTLDGDVWTIHGLHETGGTVRWRRFASGLHEPMTLAIREDQIYVFDRNGIWRLRDTNGDGEADVHELFSNAFAQTADMREFPNGLRLAPGGEFVIAKGGQQATTLGKHNGSVLRVSADGRRATVLGYGFRQPNIGVNLRTGLVTASDQQGQYIPTTPLHIVRDGQFYGFLSSLQPREEYPAPIAEPLAWLPHAVNASAISQVWLVGARMGPLNDALIHIGFNKPELFRVLLNNRGARPQAAVVSLTRDFEFPPLNGAVNPVDGQLYVAGFQILGWGTTATRAAGLARVRHTGFVNLLPREVVPMDKGVLLRFDVALDPGKAIAKESYRLASWHYQRTFKYGSPQLKADGTPGMDWLNPSSAYLSKDGRSVFVGVPDLKPVMQLRVGWSLTTADGTNFEENAYLTPYELAKFDPPAEGFGDITVDLTPRATIAQAAAPVNLAEGRRLYQLFGCAACHSLDGTSHASIGPTWKGLFGTQRPLAKARMVMADEAYLRESILDPSAKVVSGYQKSEYAMPSYAGVLTDPQIDSLILFIKSLR
ncbi:MAG: c-type cytochrome [Verrucomicrobia bacterium]|nr:c-type cytochrome [Verrucomicrobiota bacterium]